MKPIVIKYGGSLLDEPGHRSAFLKQAAALSKKEKLVLVHGGGKEITRQMEKAGLKARFVDGRRYTDEPTMKVVEEALSGLNREIVQELVAAGAGARGFSGQEDHLLEAAPVPELGRVGYPRSVNIEGFEKILAGTSLPVFYSVAEDIQHKALNINADDFALVLAVTCKAKQLIFLTDSGGVQGADGKVIPYIHPGDVDALVRAKVIKGGMIVKAQACVRALQEGVGRVDIVKGIDYLLSAGTLAPEGTVFLSGPEVRN
jgi:acetylglutamate kinase